MTELSVWSVLVSNTPLSGEEGRTQVTIGTRNGMQLCEKMACMQLSVTTVVSHGVESIVAVFIRSRTVCHKAIGRSSQGRTGYSYGEMKQSIL